MDEIKPVSLQNKIITAIKIFIGTVVYAGSILFAVVGTDPIMWQVFLYVVVAVTAIIVLLGLLLSLLGNFGNKDTSMNIAVGSGPFYINMGETGLAPENFMPIYNMALALFIILISIIVGNLNVILVNIVFALIVIIYQLIYLKKRNNLGFIKIFLKSFID